ncbi:MAG TPA: BLUF domain-containing protein [Pseudomonadales bacterium]|nr:BLUF domain-containing protein [Pseudomonadales bacterium]
MKQIVYVSKATDAFDVADLAPLAETSRSNNSAVGVTGCMLYAAGYFLQLLEGDSGEVAKVMRRISMDPRHKATKVLLDRDVDESERLYGRWFMSSINVDEKKQFPQALKDNIDKICRGQGSSMPIPKLFLEFRSHLGT